MTQTPDERPLTDQEQQLLSWVLHEANLESAGQLLSQLPFTKVVGGIPTALELSVDPRAPKSHHDDGPLPITTSVTGHNGQHLGEILVWVNSGYLSSLEFAWISDEAPTEWPSPRQVTVE